MQVPVNKRSVYAPIRYEATRPYALSLGKAFTVEAQKGEAARLQFVSGKLMRLLQAGASKMGNQRGPGPLQAECVNIQVFGGFCSGGKVIFDLSKVLAQTLIHTDAGDIPCGELVFPADSFYLHFGADAGLTADGVTIEGAFVVRVADRLVIDLVAPEFGRSNFLSLTNGESTVGAHVLLNDPAKPVSLALTEAINEIVENNAQMLLQIAELEREFAQKYGSAIKVPCPVENLSTTGPLLQKALTLIVNAMFYLAAEPEDIEEDWEPSTPKEALAAMRLATKKNTVINLESNLRNARYSKVRFVGKKFAKSVSGCLIQQAQEQGNKLATHFRRGHFRRQPYGPEKSLYKRIFVAPVVVNADSDSLPLGKIYDVC